MPVSLRSLPAALAFVLALGIGACSGPQGPSGPAGPEPAPDERTPALDLSAYEDFDASPYRARPVERRIDVEHEVPRALMESRADEGQEVTVEGFRIQIFSSLEPGLAEDQRLRFRDTWRRHAKVADSLRADSLVQDSLDLPVAPTSQRARRAVDGPLLTRVFEAEPEVYLVYKQPYYRLRVGDFAQRSEAERALDAIQAHFSNAFVVPDEVTVVR